MVPNVKLMDSQREPKACDAILQAVVQRSQLIPEVLDMINETWTKFRGEEFVPSRLADKESWPTRMFVLSKTKQTGFDRLDKNWMLPELQSKLLAMQLKSSRYAEKDEYTAYADWRNRVETSQASKKEVLTSIGEDIRAVLEKYRVLAISTGNDKHRNPIRQDLNYNESAALTYAHVKRCKLRNEADIVVPQSSTDWITRSATGATSSVKEHDQFDSCWMYSTTDGTESAVFKAQGKMVEISPQHIISCDTTDDDCNGGDLLTVFN